LTVISGTTTGSIDSIFDFAGSTTSDEATSASTGSVGIIVTDSPVSFETSFSIGISGGVNGLIISLDTVWFEVMSVLFGTERSSNSISSCWFDDEDGLLEIDGLEERTSAACLVSAWWSDVDGSFLPCKGKTILLSTNL